MLNRDEILGVQDIKVEPLLVPEWGGSVYIRSMSGKQRDEVEAELRKDASNVRAIVALHSLCDESGNLLFSSADLQALEKKSYTALDRILNASILLSAIKESEIEGLKKT